MDGWKLVVLPCQRAAVSTTIPARGFVLPSDVDPVEVAMAVEAKLRGIQESRSAPKPPELQA